MHAVVRLESVGGCTVKLYFIVFEIGQDAAGAEQSDGVVALRIDAAVAHAVVGGVDEFRIVARGVQPGEDTHVADYFRITAAAQQQDVAFLQVPEIGDIHFAAVVRLVFRRAVEVGDTEMAENIARVARAVETFRTVGSVAVGGAQERCGVFENLVGQFGGRDFHLLGLPLLEDGFLRVKTRRGQEKDGGEKQRYDEAVSHFEE